MLLVPRLAAAAAVVVVMVVVAAGPLLLAAGASHENVFATDADGNIRLRGETTDNRVMFNGRDVQEELDVAAAAAERLDTRLDSIERTLARIEEAQLARTPAPTTSPTVQTPAPTTSPTYAPNELTGTFDVRTEGCSLDFMLGVTKLIGTLFVIPQQSPDCRAITSLTPGLDALKEVTGALRITVSMAGQTNLFPSLAGLENLEVVGGWLQLQSNSKLTNLDALSKLRSVGQLTIASNSFELVNFTLPSLTNVGGDLRLSDNDALLYPRFPALKTIAGNLEVSFMRDLPSLKDVFPALETVGGDIKVCSNSALAIAEVPSSLQTLAAGTGGSCTFICPGNCGCSCP